MSDKDYEKEIEELNKRIKELEWWVSDWKMIVLDSLLLVEEGEEENQKLKENINL